MAEFSQEFPVKLEIGPDDLWDGEDIMLVIYAFQYFIGYSFSENKRTFFRTGIAKAASRLAGKGHEY
jgi:hypothetical protein